MGSWFLLLTAALMVVPPTTPQCFSSNDKVAQPSPSDLATLSTFSIDLYKTMFLNANSTPSISSPPSSPPPGNHVLAPYSVWKALSLAYFGSSGSTQKQLEEVLGAKDKISALKLWAYLDRVYGGSTGELQMGGRVYVSGRRQLRPCVEDILQHSLHTIDFSNVYRASSDINKWVGRITNSRGGRVYQPNDLLGVNAVLVSAGSFRGSWLHPFKSSSSRRQPFYTTRDDPSDVTTMTQKGYFEYGESQDLGVQILELPYRDSSVALYILLPPLELAGPQGIDETLKALTPSTLGAALGSLRPAVVRVVLPKFKIQFDAGELLLEALSRMGAGDLFTPAADLTVFSPDGGLVVGRAGHKAIVEVDEGGTDAASAKYFDDEVMIQPPALRGALKHRVFVCNRPFVFLLRDRETERTLFLGVFRDPRA